MPGCASVGVLGRGWSGSSLGLRRFGSEGSAGDSMLSGGSSLYELALSRARWDATPATPTRSVFYRRYWSEHKSSVGASLLANAVCQARMICLTCRLREQARPTGAVS